MKSCAVQDRIYIIGDDVNFEWTHLVEYNTRTNIWRTLSSFECRSDSLCAGFLFYVGNKLYIDEMIDEMIDDDHDHDKDVDHMSICMYSKVLDSLDDEDEKWKQIKVDVDDDFFDLSVAVEDECIYLVGGKCEIEKYDVRQDLWIIVTQLPDEMSKHYTAVAVLDGKIYVSDGVSFQCYDTSTENWTSLARMNHDRSNCYLRLSLLIKNGSLVVVGGDAIEEYDVASDTWTVKVENLVDYPESEVIDGPNSNSIYSLRDNIY